MEPWVLTIIGIVLTALTTAVATTWRVSNLFHKNDTKIIKMMAEHELADTRRFAETNAAIVAMGDAVQRNVGENFNAIRQKIHEVEMWSRDTLLSKKTFETVQREHGIAMQALSNKVDTQTMKA